MYNKPIFEFQLSDIIYISQDILYKLHRFNISKITSLLEIDENNLHSLLGIDLNTIKRIYEHAQLLFHQKIPCVINISTDHVIWVGSSNDEIIDYLGIFAQDSNIYWYQNVKIQQFERLLVNFEPILIGNQGTISKTQPILSWNRFISDGLLINCQKPVHDYLISVLKNNESLTHQKLTYLRYTKNLTTTTQIINSSRIKELINKYVNEIKMVLTNLHYLKQARRSSTIESSDNKTPSRPPRL